MKVELTEIKSYRRKQAWTLAEEIKLLHLFQSKVILEAIALELGRTYSSVHNKLRQLGEI